MSTQTLDRGQLQGSDEDDPEHYVCPCDPTLAMCGVMLGPEEAEDGDATCGACIVALNIGNWRCPTCGCRSYENCEGCSR